MCGIFSFSGSNFNKYKFNILGLYNDSRGGDSCGTVSNIGESIKVGYGYDKTKLYAKYVEAGAAIDDSNLNFALGHCRKASVGGIGQRQAQPVVLYAKKEVDGVEIEYPIFAMIHNGTLVNYKALAEKHNVQYDPLETDSQIFCRVVYKVGYKALGEYQGAGAFMFWDKRDGYDTIKVFKGASLYYSNDNNMYVERPLHVMHSMDGLYFSSMEESLSFINDDKSIIEEVAHNILFTIKQGKVVSEIPIDRSKMWQSLTLAWKPGVKNELPRHSYGAYDRDSYDDYYGNHYGYRNKFDYNKDSHQGKQKEIPFNDKIKEKLENEKMVFLNTTDTDSILKPKYLAATKVYYDVDGLYKIDGLACDGEMKLTDAGYTSGYDVKPYWFCAGVLMKTYFDYLCAKEYLLRNFGHDPEDIVHIYLAPYSAGPVPFITEYEDDKGKGIFDICLYAENNKGDAEEFTGNFSPYFSFTKEIYSVQDGYITKHTSYTGKSIYIRSEAETSFDSKIMNNELTEMFLLQMIENNL